MMMNPILEREVKSRTRTWRSALSISFYLGFILLVTFIGFNAAYDFENFGFQIKRISVLFDVIIFAQLGIIMFITPILTSSAIASEREHQTLDLMLCTDVSMWTIIFGKIFSAISYVILLIVLSLPFLAISFIFGGISIVDILKIIFYYIATAFTFASVSIYSSCKFRKNITAIVMSYVILFFIYMIPLFISIIGERFLRYNFYEKSIIFEFFKDNSYLVVSLLFGSNPYFGMLSFTTSSEFKIFLNQMTNATVGSKTIFPFILGIPTWIISLFFFSIISFIMLNLAKKNLEKKVQ